MEKIEALRADIKARKVEQTAADTPTGSSNEKEGGKDAETKTIPVSSMVEPQGSEAKPLETPPAEERAQEEFEPLLTGSQSQPPFASPASPENSPVETWLNLIKSVMMFELEFLKNAFV